MAKNFVQEGHCPEFTAPAGGVTAGVPVVLGTLVVIPLTDAAEGEGFAGRTGGVWSLPCAAGLTLGAKVGWLDGELVAAATAEAVEFGKLITAEAGGYADALLSN